MKDTQVNGWVAALVWVLLIALFISVDARQRPAPMPMPKASVDIATDGEYPVDVVTIRRAMSSRGRICVEPASDGQRVVCISVGEFRDWMAKRTTAK